MVGLYLLSHIQKLDMNVGLYRDDGLATGQKTPQQAERLKKELCKVFSENGLKITVEANKKCVDFLDVTLDLNTGTFMPFSKPNNNIQYVHKESNHPPSILKNIPLSINKRLSKISSNSSVFTRAAPQYQEALRKSGYRHPLKFETSHPNNSSINRNRRNRNITWFNPPYSDNVGTNVGRRFLSLIEQCFPPENSLHKIFNRNTLKLSYSCMPNMKQKISAHNKAILKSEPNPEPNRCNCRTQPCPLDGNCLAASLVYQATVERGDNSSKDTYVGLTEGPFKTRFSSHKYSFSNQAQRNTTALSKHVWSLKDSGTPYKITWRILARARPYSPISKRCNLCTTEKYYIICHPSLATLNNRNELASSCRHRRKFLLKHAAIT